MAIDRAELDDLIEAQKNFPDSLKLTPEDAALLVEAAENDLTYNALLAIACSMLARCGGKKEKELAVSLMTYLVIA